MNYFTTIALCIVAIIGAVTVAEATDYCDKDLCPNAWEQPHIGCNHNNQFNRTCPQDASLVDITPKLRNLLLKLHNEKRNFVAGGGAARHRPACKMGTMEWDDELAKLAELNVMQCKMNHDNCHNTKAYPLAGQNLAFESYYGTPNYEQLMTNAVQGWYDEISGSKMAIINSYPEGYSGPVITHFTGMMLEGNTRVGCAAATYTNNGDPYKIHLLACNMAYKTMVTQPIYKSCRTPGSKCKTGKNPLYLNLCSSSEQYDITGNAY